MGYLSCEQDSPNSSAEFLLDETEGPLVRDNRQVLIPPILNDGFVLPNIRILENISLRTGQWESAPELCSAYAQASLGSPPIGFITTGKWLIPLYPLPLIAPQVLGPDGEFTRGRRISFPDNLGWIVDAVQTPNELALLRRLSLEEHDERTPAYAPSVVYELSRYDPAFEPPPIELPEAMLGVDPGTKEHRRRGRITQCLHFSVQDIIDTISGGDPIYIQDIVIRTDDEFGLTILYLRQEIPHVVQLAFEKVDQEIEE